METLYIFVEGSDDERYFNWYFNKPNVKLFKYANEKVEKTNKFIKSIKSMPNSNYLFISDSDGHDINERIGELKRKYSNLDDSNIFISCYEIESWYFSGLTNEKCQKFKIKYLGCTDCLTKEMFNNNLPIRLDRISFMIEILNQYSTDNAIKLNQSFSYFYQNYSY